MLDLQKVTIMQGTEKKIDIIMKKHKVKQRRGIVDDGKIGKRFCLPPAPRRVCVEVSFN